MKKFFTALIFLIMLTSTFSWAETTSSTGNENEAAGEQTINEGAKDRDKKKDTTKDKKSDDEDPDCE